MRKHTVCLWFMLVLLCLCQPAMAQQSMEEIAAPSQLSFQVTDTDERTDAIVSDRILQVTIQSTDGVFYQPLRYQSSMDPAIDHLAAMVRQEDINFDGHKDLLLLTAQSPRNVLYAVSLWDPYAGQFLPVLQMSTWDSETQSLTWEATQLELCNHRLFPEDRLILSSLQDGYRYQTETVYDWEGREGLHLRSVADVYDAGNHQIGETVVLFGTDVLRCWDEQYPEDWYYGQDGVSQERLSSIHEMTLGCTSRDPVFLQVANVDWVNLRKQDSKASPSLAKLPRGTPVIFLKEDIMEEGWIRVWIPPEGEGAGLTGYIWHSFLEPAH